MGFKQCWQIAWKMLSIIHYKFLIEKVITLHHLKVKIVTIHLETSVHASNLTCRPAERRHYGLIELDTESKDGASGDCDAYAEKKRFSSILVYFLVMRQKCFPASPAPFLDSRKGLQI